MLRIYSAAQQTGRDASPQRTLRPAMPELPEVETTRRGVGAARRRTARRRARQSTTGGCAGRFPEPADRRSTAARSTRIDRRSKYLLFRARRRTRCSSISGMTGSLRAFARRAAARSARSRRHRARLGHDAALSRSAPLRRDAVAAGTRRRAPAARAAWVRSRSIAAMRRATISGAATARPDGGDQARADGQPCRRRRRKHLRERIAVSRRHPADDAGAPRLAGTARAGWSTQVRATLRDAIAKGGSTLRDYVDSDGEPGYFQLDYFVYGREGQPLPGLRQPQSKSVRQGGRATTYCPRCQR